MKFQLNDANGNSISSLSAAKSITYKPESSTALSSDLGARQKTRSPDPR